MLTTPATGPFSLAWHAAGTAIKQNLYTIAPQGMRTIGQRFGTYYVSAVDFTCKLIAQTCVDATGNDTSISTYLCALPLNTTQFGQLRPNLSERDYQPPAMPVTSGVDTFTNAFNSLQTMPYFQKKLLNGPAGQRQSATIRQRWNMNKFAGVGFPYFSTFHGSAPNIDQGLPGGADPSTMCYQYMGLYSNYAVGLTITQNFTVEYSIKLHVTWFNPRWVTGMLRAMPPPGEERKDPDDIDPELVAQLSLSDKPHSIEEDYTMSCSVL